MTTGADPAKHYADRDHVALGQRYIDHVVAMTAEGLHGKSQIAAELAWRDAEMDQLRMQLAAVSEELNQVNDFRAAPFGSIRALIGEDDEDDEALMGSVCAVLLAHQETARRLRIARGVLEQVRATVTWIGQGAGLDTGVYVVCARVLATLDPGKMEAGC